MAADVSERRLHALQGCRQSRALEERRASSVTGPGSGSSEAVGTTTTRLAQARLIPIWCQYLTVWSRRDGSGGTGLSQ